MKKLIAIFVVVFAVTTGVVATRISANTQPSYDYSCPTGQEPIGAGACRITPTGCPYGDSIPMGKCEAPQHPSCQSNGKCFPEKPKKSAPKPKPKTQPKANVCGQ